jgi:hypothetical protein
VRRRRHRYPHAQRGSGFWKFFCGGTSAAEDHRCRCKPPPARPNSWFRPVSWSPFRLDFMLTSVTISSVVAGPLCRCLSREQQQHTPGSSCISSRGLRNTMGCKGCQRCCDNPLPRRPPPNFSPLFFTNSLIETKQVGSSAFQRFFVVGFLRGAAPKKRCCGATGPSLADLSSVDLGRMVSISSAFISAHRRAWALCAMPNIAGSQGFWENISRDYVRLVDKTGQTDLPFSFSQLLALWPVFNFCASSWAGLSTAKLPALPPPNTPDRSEVHGLIDVPASLPDIKKKKIPSPSHPSYVNLEIPPSSESFELGSAHCGDIALVTEAGSQEPNPSITAPHGRPSQQ